MPQVTVTVNGHPYAVACDPGEEPRIRELARLVESKVENFARASPRGGEARLLMLAALVLADELTEAGAKREGGAALPRADDPALAAALERLAHRIEVVAQRLEAGQI